MTKKIDPQRKYWWLIVIVVPIVLALIGITPNLIDSLNPKPSPLPQGISITNAKINNMYFVTQVMNASDPAKAQAAQQVIQSVTGLVQNQDYANAIAQLEQAATQYPYPAIYNNLGVLYADLGEYDKARAAYNNALKLDPNDQAANFNLGLLEQFQGNASAAQIHLNKAPGLYDPAALTPTASVALPVPTVSGVTVSTQIPGVTAQLLEFSKFQNTITLKVRLINSSAKDASYCNVTQGHLLDEATNKTYEISDQGNTGCSFGVPANGNIDEWVKYSLPEGENPQYLTAVLNYGILFEHLTPK